MPSPWHDTAIRLFEEDPAFGVTLLKHYGDGRAEGSLDTEREAVLDVLAVRELTPADGERQRILDCTDIDQLKAWHKKAVTAVNVGDLFG